MVRLLSYGLFGVFGSVMVFGLGAGCAAGEEDPVDPSGSGTTTVTTGTTSTGQGGNGGTGGMGQGGSSLCEMDCTTIDAPDCFMAVCNDGTYAGPVGQCVVVETEAGTPCDDGQFCTVDDTCQAGVCTGGAANTCGMMAGACESIACDEGTNSCAVEPANDGAACDPGDLCLTGSTCSSGLCTGGTPKDCFLAPVPNECFVPVCNPQNGMCEPIAGNDGQPCTDANDLCTVNKTCNAGVCLGGNPKDCSANTMGCDLGVCDTNTGQCITQPVMDGQMCDDLDGCTLGEICTMGTCGGGTAVTNCSLVGDNCCPSNCTPANDLDCQCSQSNIATAQTNGSGWESMMFDVGGTQAIEVLTISTNIDVGANQVELYYKMGTHLGFESNAAAWTLLGSAPVTPNATGFTQIPIPVNIQIPNGQLAAFYISFPNATSNTAGIGYRSGGTIGQVSDTDGTIEIYAGTSQTKNFGTASVFTPRQFAGSIDYEICGT